MFLNDANLIRVSQGYIANKHVADQLYVK